MKQTCTSRVKPVLVVAIIAALFLSIPVFAGWATKEDADVILEKNHDQVKVKADGSYEVYSDVTFLIQKEAGIEALKLMRLGYDPNISSMTILSAETINPTGSMAVPASQIEDKAIASAGDGMSSRQQITIPFPALQIGSRINYKSVIKYKEPFVPGQFSMGFAFADRVYTVADVTEIRSELPLFLKSHATEEIAIVEKGMEGNLHKIKVTLSRPMWRTPKGEPYPAFNVFTQPRMQASSEQDWGSIQKFIGSKLDTSLMEALPPDFDAIVKQAASQPSQALRAKFVMAKLIEQVKYLGDWRTERNYYLPRTMQEIATTKQGDCKDFSLATVAMLRALGIKAHIAWVNRGLGPMDSLNPLLPALDHFNHAILRAELDGKAHWLDPTNPISHVGSPFNDIADRQSLVFDGSITLAQIPPSDQGSAIETISYHAFRRKGQADVLANVSIRGALYSELERTKAKYPEQARKTFYASLATDKDDIQHLGLVSDLEPESFPKPAPGETNQTFSYSTGNRGKETSMGNIFTLHPFRVAQRFMVESGGGRVSGLDLGLPGVYSRRQILANLDLQGAPPSGCKIESKWASIVRNIQARKGGLEITDFVHIKSREISLAEMNGAEYVQLQKQVELCFAEKLLIYKWRFPELKNVKSAPMPNPLILNKKNLLARGRVLSNYADQDYFIHPYARLLFLESIHVDPTTAISALSSMGASLSREGMINNVERDPEMAAEAEFLEKQARNIGPQDPSTILDHAYSTLHSKNFSEAVRLANTVPPSSHEFGRSRILILLAKMYSAPKGEQGKEQLLESARLANSMMADPLIHCKDCVNEILINIYTRLGLKDEVERAYLRKAELKPRSAWVMLNLANYMNEKNEFAKAADYSRRALKIAQVGMARITLSSALAGLAAMELKKDLDSPKGIDLCAEALQEYRGNPDCLLLMYFTYLRRSIVNGDAQALTVAKNYRAEYLQIGQPKADKLVLNIQNITARAIEAQVHGSYWDEEIKQLWAAQRVRLFPWANLPAPSPWSARSGTEPTTAGAPNGQNSVNPPVQLTANNWPTRQNAQAIPANSQGEKILVPSLPENKAPPSLYGLEKVPGVAGTFQFAQNMYRKIKTELERHRIIGSSKVNLAATPNSQTRDESPSVQPANPEGRAPASAPATPPATLPTAPLDSPGPAE